VLALPDGFLEMDGAESRRCCKNDDVSQGNGLLVSIEPDELAVRRHVDLFAMLFLERLEGTFQAVPKSVAHGD
jgi:hypothetical protein